ncbi:chemotaxis protein CheB [Pyxidicoccus sp. 3LFB2]
MTCWPRRWAPLRAARGGAGRQGRPRPRPRVPAPAGYHLLVDKGCVSLSVEPPEHGQRPCLDALFESAGDSYGPRAAGLLFTGHEDAPRGWRCSRRAAPRGRGG